MKKFLMIAALAVAGLAQADDSWLYWMVSGNNTIGGDWDYAKVKVLGTSEKDAYLTLSSGYDTFASVEYSGAAKSAESKYALDSVAAQLGTYASSSYSYMIELYYDDEVVATSDTLSYSAAAAYIGSEMSPAGDTWNASTWHIPEPSSGLLALLGMSLLALRRRRLKA